MSNSFTRKEMGILMQCGWDETRRIDISGIVTALESKRILVHGYALTLLAQFEGIRFPCTSGVLQFDALESLAFFADDDLQYLETQSGFELVPLAQLGMVILLCSDTEKIIILDQQWICFEIIDSIELAIGKLLGTRKVTGIAVILPDEDQ